MHKPLFQKMQAAQQQEKNKTATSQSKGQPNTADPTSQPSALASGNTTTSEAPLNQVFLIFFVLWKSSVFLPTILMGHWNSQFKIQ